MAGREPVGIASARPGLAASAAVALAYGVVLPVLMSEWGLTPVQAGALGSYALFGMMFGAFVFGPLADRIGRKKGIAICFVLFSASTFLNGFATSPTEFGIYRFIAGLEERNRESAERVRALMFVFEDLSKLDPGGVQTLLREVPKEQLALALKGASDDLRGLFSANMSGRAAKIREEDMQAMGPVRLKDVDTAQMAMVKIAKDLSARGEIILLGSRDDDEMIY